MRIYEIYRSIQGESTYAGMPCTFIRTAGCSLRCSYCDTAYTWSPRSGEEKSLDRILERVQTLGLDLVEITGGEPLEQKETPDLCRVLLSQGAKVLMETGGAYRIDMLPPEVVKIVDMKTPSSNMESRNEYANLSLLYPHDEIKFVIGNRGDFTWSVQLCRQYKLLGKYPIHFSPVFGQMLPAELAQWILQENIPVRLHLQLHKYLWPLEMRGV